MKWIMNAHNQVETWRREYESSLLAQIRINNAIQRSLRTELAQLRKLEGSALVARYGWESQREINKTMKSKDEFERHIEDLFVEGSWTWRKGA